MSKYIKNKRNKSEGIISSKSIDIFFILIIRE